MPLNSIGRIILLPWEQEVECSNHSAPTSLFDIKPDTYIVSGFFVFCSASFLVAVFIFSDIQSCSLI